MRSFTIIVREVIPLEFPLILLQAKAVSFFSALATCQVRNVSINSPSGEGGELFIKRCSQL